MAFALTLVYVALNFLRPQEVHPELIRFQPMNILGLVAMGTTVLMLAMGQRPNLRGLELPLGLSFLLWSAFSVAAALGWLGGAVMTLHALSVSFFAYVLVVLNATTLRRLGLVVLVAIGSLFIILLLAGRAYYSGTESSPFFIVTASRGSIDFLADSGDSAQDSAGEEGGSAIPKVKRIQGLGFLADPNDFAQALAAMVPLVFLLWRRHRPFGNLILVLLPTAVALWGTLLTRSRGTLIALAALLVVSWLFRLGPRYRRRAMVAALTLAIPGFIVLFGYAKADSSASTRLEAWSAGLLMLKSSPIWGVGSGLFTDHHERVAHNSYVQCFAETGLVGYFLWLGLLVVTTTRLSRLADTTEDPTWARWARALRLSVFTFLFASLFLSRTTSPMLFFVLALPAALLGMAGRAGEEVRTPRTWWIQTAAIETASILLVWITSRAFYY